MGTSSCIIFLRFLKAAIKFFFKATKDSFFTCNVILIYCWIVDKWQPEWNSSVTTSSRKYLKNFFVSSLQGSFMLLHQWFLDSHERNFNGIINFVGFTNWPTADYDSISAFYLSIFYLPNCSMFCWHICCRCLFQKKCSNEELGS